MLFHQHIAIYYRYKYVLIPPTMGVYETTVSCSHRLNIITIFLQAPAFRAGPVSKLILCRSLS